MPTDYENENEDEDEKEGSGFFDNIDDLRVSLPEQTEAEKKRMARALALRTEHVRRSTSGTQGSGRKMAGSFYCGI